MGNTAVEDFDALNRDQLLHFIMNINTGKLILRPVNSPANINALLDEHF
jgi:hypothetical protein